MHLFFLIWIIIFGHSTKDKLIELERRDPCEMLRPPPWCKDEE
jgi:hypothetical protein